MNQAVIKIRFYTMALSTILLGVDITLFCFVQYNIWKLPIYRPEPAVRGAHMAAEVTTLLTCIMCFGQCYVACFERMHSKKHRKAIIFGVVSTFMFLANTVCYLYILKGRYQYNIPTRNMTVFSPESMNDIWFDEIRSYVKHYEEKKNDTQTRESAFQYLKTLDYFQDISHCCGVISYNDYTVLGVPVPQSCECGKHESIIHQCTRGVKTSSSLRAGGGMTDIRRLMAEGSNISSSANVRWHSVVGRAHYSEHDADDHSSEESRGKKKDDHPLKKAVHADGCHGRHERYVYVLTIVLRLLVTSNSIQFLSIIMIPIPWLYET